MKLSPRQSSTVLAPNQNIENNPMQSSRPVAGTGDAGDTI
jgi:hypothetical protein